MVGSLIFPAPSCAFLHPSANDPGSSVRDGGTLRARVEALYSAEQREDWRSVFGLLPPGSDLTLAGFLKGSEARDFKILRYRIRGIRSADVSEACFQPAEGAAMVEMDVTIERFSSVPEK